MIFLIIIKNISNSIIGEKVLNTVLGDASRLIPELTARNLEENARVGSGIRKIMSRQLENYGINILQLHAEWLVANGYKREATSCKQQIRMILINKKKKERQAAGFKLHA